MEAKLPKLADYLTRKGKNCDRMFNIVNNGIYQC